ncbi:hypothetical protein [Salipiger thiooxidans]|uniref:hypothetical protein n=1 Tax=Salipiger thiooxidans TaxID=282683 RepID=UPI001CFC4676|nr:hypothetical protein [Salipiger thiooxidans]
MTNKGNVDIGIGVNLLDVTEGQQLRLKNGRIGEVTENMGDGQWVEMRFQDNDDVELIHSQEIDSIV